jgi:hypothetical protein
MLLTAAGFGILQGLSVIDNDELYAWWGQVSGIIVAIVSSLADFAFLPYYPLSTRGPCRPSWEVHRDHRVRTSARRPP